MDLQSLAQYLPDFSADWIILGALILFLTFDAMRAGSARAVAISIALPLALLLSSSIAQTAFIGNFFTTTAPAVQTGVFLGLCLGLFVALYRIVDTRYESSHILQALMAGVAGGIITILVLLELPEATMPWTFGEAFNVYFGETYRLFWFVGSYFLLAIART